MEKVHTLCIEKYHKMILESLDLRTELLIYEKIEY